MAKTTTMAKTVAMPSRPSWNPPPCGSAVIAPIGITFHIDR